MPAVQIYKKRDGKYTFDVPAFKGILASSKSNPVAIYSLTGPFRSGKSFMLSFFLKYLLSAGKPNWIETELRETFKYREGSERETTGIWMWSEPFVRKIKGREVSIFLLDTQGCFDDQTTTGENAVVFALSVLLSSCMIFNLTRQLDEAILQFLQYFTGHARLAEDENKDEPFQKLFFLIRDWDFPDYEPGYYDEHTSISGKNYKVDKLNAHSSQPDQIKFVHESILAAFDKVSCYLMRHPGKKVSRESIFHLNSVDEEFLENVKEFVPLVLRDENIMLKKIGGHQITGKQLTLFVEKWAKMFDGNEVPNTKTIFETTAELQNEMAKAAAIEKYSRDIKIEANGKPDKKFESSHSKLFNESIELFKKFKRLGGTAYEIKYTAIITESLQMIYEYYIQINRSQREYNETQQKCAILAKDIDDSKREFESLKTTTEQDKVKFQSELAENNAKLEQYQAEMDGQKEAAQKAAQEVLDLKRDIKIAEANHTMQLELEKAKIEKQILEQQNNAKGGLFTYVGEVMDLGLFQKKPSWWPK